MSRRACALPTIALCFLGSAVLRGESMAEDAGRALTARPVPATMAVTHPDPVPGRAIDPCSTRGLIDRIKAREAALTKREAELNARAARLDVVGERVAALTAKLANTKDALAATVAHVDGAQERDIAHLVTMYSTMKPKRAGRLFDEMDVAFASELLVRMKPESAALVLANMDPESAFTISVLIARRNSGAPKN